MTTDDDGSSQKRVTLERVLRDADNDSGQSTRTWKLSIEGNHVSIRGHEEHPILIIRVDDVETLQDDLVTIISR